MPLLAQLVVEYVADVSKLTSGVQAAAKAQSNMTNMTSKAATEVSALAKKADAAGISTSKLSQLQAKASESAAKVGVAEAKAAESLQKANSLANSGAASAEKIAVAQSNAALAAEKVRVAESNASASMQKVQSEASRLSSAMEDGASKSGGLKGVLTGLIPVVQAAGIALLAVGTAAVGLGAKSIQMAGDYDASITTLQTGAGEFANNMDTVKNGILDMAPAVGTSTQQLVNGMFMIESAGYHGKDGLDVLRMAAEGAKVGNADLKDTANGVTTVMADYSAQNLTAAQATNGLVGMLKNGKSTMGELASSMKDILPIASTANISFTDIAGAMATMTGKGTPAAQSATYLRGAILALNAPSSSAADAMKEVGLSAQQISTKMKESLPDALKMITDAVGKKFPEGSAAYMASLKNIAGGTESLSGILALTGSNMSTFAGNSDKIAKSVNGAGNSIDGWAKTQQDFNFKVDQGKEVIEALGVKVGEKLLPAAGKLLDKITPLVKAFGDWLINSGALDAVTNDLGNVFSSLSGQVGNVSNAVNTVIGFFKQAWDAMQSPAVQKVFKAFQDLGSFIATSFAPIWKELVVVWQTELQPALAQLGQALQPLLPVLGAVAVLIGAVLIGAITGFALGLSMLIQGLIGFVSGVIQIVTGIVEVVSGILSFFIDLFTGNFSKLGTDLQNIWNGILNIGHGFGEAMVGLFVGVFGTIGGFVWGFISGIIGFFQHLYDVLVGHSIIPDMVNGIVSWIAQLPGRVGAFVMNLVTRAIMYFNMLYSAAVVIVTRLVNNVVNFFQQLPGRVMGFLQSLPGRITGLWSTIITDATNAGSNIVKGIADGISGAIHFVSDAITNVTSWISAHLPHSPAKVGPLRHLQEQGAEISNQIAKGMVNGMPVLSSAIGNITKPIALSVKGVGAANTKSTPSQGKQTVIIEDHTHQHFYFDGDDMTNRVMTKVQKKIQPRVKR